MQTKITHIVSCMKTETHILTVTMLKYHRNNNPRLQLMMWLSAIDVFQSNSPLEPQVEKILIMYLPLVIHCLGIGTLTGTSFILQLFHADTCRRLRKGCIDQSCLKKKKFITQCNSVLLDTGFSKKKSKNTCRQIMTGFKNNIRLAELIQKRKPNQL